MLWHFLFFFIITQVIPPWTDGHIEKVHGNPGYQHGNTCFFNSAGQCLMYRLLVFSFFPVFFFFFSAVYFTWRSWLSFAKPWKKKSTRGGPTKRGPIWSQSRDHSDQSNGMKGQIAEAFARPYERYRHLFVAFACGCALCGEVSWVTLIHHA